MQQTISTTVGLSRHNSYASSQSLSKGLFTTFINWCATQQKKSFFWTAISLMGGIATVLPLTLFAIVFIGGNSLALWMIACAVNVPILAVNLAAQPTRTTLPVLFFAWFVNAILITYSIVHFFVG